MAIAGRLASIYIGTYKVAEQNGFNLQCGYGEIDVTSLDSSGWKEVIQGIKDWSCSSDGNFKPSDANGQAALINAWLNGTPVNIEFRVNSTIKFAGSAYVKFNVSANTSDKAAINFDFTGTGALTPTLA